MKKEGFTCWNNGRNLFYRYELLRYIKEGKKGLDDILYDAEKIHSIYQTNNISKYFNISYKNIKSDNLDKNDKNIILINFLKFTNLIFFLKNLQEEICDFAKKHSLKIYLLYIEHPFEQDYIEEFDKVFKENCSNDYFKRNNIKIIINSFDELKNSKYKDVFINVDTYPYVMRMFSEKEDIREEYPFIENRIYDFSLLVGDVSRRFERIVILNTLFEMGILDENFFYTIICPNKNNVIDFIEYKFLEENNTYTKNEPGLKESIKKNINLFLQYKVYDENGNPLKDDTSSVYENNMDYKIPLQVRQSCINILFETKTDTPAITEKMYKPIVAGIPFLWFGPPNVLPYLKSRGYKEYPFINYTFDSIEDNFLRMKSLIKEIKRLKLFGVDNLKKIVNQYKNISLYNQDVFIKNTENFNELLSKIDGSEK
jgi:hypothetical protein